MEPDYNRLLLLCDRTNNLPPLSASVLRLMQAIENAGASASQLAQITAADPMLAAKILRAANSQWGVNGLAQISSIQGAILRLGHQAVRSIAISLSVQATFATKKEGCSFDPSTFARHSVLVGLVARYVFARALKSRPGASAVSPEEVLAAGVLHDLPLGILAFVAPDTYESLQSLCQGKRINAEQGFEMMFSGSLRELGGRVMEAWHMPTNLAAAVHYAASPDDAPSERLPLQSICYANAVVDRHAAETRDVSHCHWIYEVSIAEDVQAAVGLEAEELDLVFSKLLEQVEFYLPSKLSSADPAQSSRRAS